MVCVFLVLVLDSGQAKAEEDEWVHLPNKCEGGSLNYRKLVA